MDWEPGDMGHEGWRCMIHSVGGLEQDGELWEHISLSRRDGLMRPGSRSAMSSTMSQATRPWGSSGAAQVPSTSISKRWLTSGTV